MKIEKSSPDAEGKDIIQYRCGRWTESSGCDYSAEVEMCQSEGKGEIKEAFSDGISSLADDSGSRAGGVWIRRVCI
jgi:hypothetical protein